MLCNSQGTKVVSFQEKNWYLNLAVSVGNVRMANSLLSLHQADVNSKNNGFSILHVAVNRQDAEMVRLLIRHNVNLNPDPNTTAEPQAANERPIMSPLWSAMVQKYDDIAELLIKAGADVNERSGPFDASFLHMAAASANIPRLQLLLAHGADPNARNGQGKTVLQFALLCGKYETVKLLLGYGADVQQADEDGMTVLHQAALAGDVGIVTLLLEFGADAAQTDDQGSSALHYTASASKHAAQVAQILVEAGTPIDGLNSVEFTPLHCAILAGNVGMVRYLIQQGADVNCKSRLNGLFPLFISVQRGNVSLINMLFDHGARVNERTMDDETALHEACAQGSEKLVRLLLGRGADPEIVDTQGKTPIWNVDVRNAFGTAALVVKKFARLETVNAINLSFVRGFPTLSRFYDECCEELELMRTETIDRNVRFSYRYLLQQEHARLVQIVRNVDVVRSFESRRHYQLFPKFAEDLQVKYERAKTEADRIASTEERVYQALGDHLTDSDIRKIAQYLLQDETS